MHYVYAGKGVNSGDTGDIYYVCSTDDGLTWSAPIVLNTDQAAGGTKAQWMPSLSVTASGDVYAHWYDRRNTTNGQKYEVWADGQLTMASAGYTAVWESPRSQVLGRLV
ncbi:MAG: hypothetical protein M3Z96_02795 [Pseudomonadota bacterium]|nr:hypothetical protein [Pseudomonadota bacterium]